MDVNEISGARAAEILNAMAPAEIDTVTEMETRGDDGWVKIVTGVRDAVAEAFESDRYANEESGDVNHEIADGQVPVYNAHRMDELRIIGAAWHHETETDTTGADLLTIIGYVLYDVYRAAADALVEYVREQLDDDPADDDDDPADD